MKTKNKIAEITFENYIQLRDVLEEAWLRGKLEQSTDSLNKESKFYARIAKKLGIKNLEEPKLEKPMTFQEWFLEMAKKIQRI